jgi:hypothetical protein
MKPGRFTCRATGAGSLVTASVLILALWPVPLAFGQATTNCFADRVVSFAVGAVSAPPAFNSWQPGILLGPPGSATPTTGSTSVMSLGRGGEIVLEFTDNEIIDRPGPDFILFENPFFCTAPPQSAADGFSVFAEPGIVAVSEDGVDFRAFPYNSLALSQVVSQCSDKTLLQSLIGLMGITPSFTGNYTLPDDPLVYDPAAPGGISGHGGDAFDLATVGLQRARFVRITDPNLSISLPGSAEGLDLDAAVALHSLPRLGPGQADTDNDGLSDEAESFLYHTNPLDPDTDGDGVLDGEEAAACRDPRVAGVEAFFLPVLGLEVNQASPTLLRWNFLGPGVTYDAVRGGVGALRSIGGMTDLGVVTCLENDSTDLTTRGLADAVVPLVGQAFFYAVRQNPKGSGLGYGASTTHEPRLPASGDCL